MERERILALEPGRQMDALVAEHVFGLTVGWHPDGTLQNRLHPEVHVYRVECDGAGYLWEECPHYSTESALLIVIWNRLRPDWQLHLTNMVDGWVVNAHRFGIPSESYQVAGDTPAEALCRLALLIRLPHTYPDTVEIPTNPL